MGGNPRSAADAHVGLRASRMTLERAAWLLLCAFVFSLPLEKALEVPGIGTISRIIGLLAFAAGVLAIARRRKLRPPNAALLLAAAFVLWSALTWFWTVSPPVTAIRIATMVQLLAMLYLVWELCRSGPAQAWLLRAYAAGAVVSAAFTLARYAVRLQTYYRRYATPGFEPNDLGITLALAIPMLLYLAGQTRGLAAWTYRAAVLPVIAAILLTASRTALVAACFGFVYTVLTWRRSTTAQRAASVALFFLLGLGTVRLAPPASRARLATLPTELTQGTLHDRTRIWKAGLKVFKHHWAVGIGSGAYPKAVFPSLGRPKIPAQEYVAHNTFLSVLVETGVVGFTLFSLLLAALLLFIWMLEPAVRALWITALAVWITGVSTLTWENRKPTFLLFALIMTAWALAFRPREDAA